MPTLQAVESTDIIPKPLAERLDELRPVLSRQGVIQTNGRRHWLRYRDTTDEASYQKHRSIPLGTDPILAAAVGELLAAWRQQYQAEEQAKRATEAERAAKARAEVLEWHGYAKLAAMTVALSGGSRRSQRAAKRIVRVAAGGDCQAMLSVMTRGLPVFRGRAGRPRKGGLY